MIITLRLYVYSIDVYDRYDDNKNKLIWKLGNDSDLFMS